VATGRPEAPDFAEPARVAQAIAKMGLRHAVITAVARDDLPDGGAQIWAATVRAVRYRNPQTAIEILIPDFRGNNELLDIVLQASPDILNHNLETVERLQRPVRKTARYQRSLDVLRHAKARGFVTKSGLMLGIGEQDHEVRQALQDLRAAGCDILTLGQYLQPTPRHRAVDRWVTPEAFAQWKAYALELGFGVVESGPLVRSSYHAEEQSGRYTPKGTPAAAGPLPQGAQATPCGPEVHAAAAAG
jgi:lipoic acid synthetase